MADVAGVRTTVVAVAGVRTSVNVIADEVFCFFQVPGYSSWLEASSTSTSSLTGFRVGWIVNEEVGGCTGSGGWFSSGLFSLDANFLAGDKSNG